MEYVPFDVKIPKLPAWISERVRENARSATSEGTLRAHIENLLRQDALSKQHKVYERMKQHQAMMRQKYPHGTGTDSVEIMRSIRDDRG